MFLEKDSLDLFQSEANFPLVVPNSFILFLLSHAKAQADKSLTSVK